MMVLKSAFARERVNIADGQCGSLASFGYWELSIWR